MTQQPLPQPGWYDDPGGSNQERYWEGTRWTKNLRERPDPIPGPDGDDRRAVVTSPAPAPQPPAGMAQRGAMSPPQYRPVPAPTAPAPVGFKMVRTTQDGVPLAGFGIRALATAIDWVVMGVLGALLAWPWSVRVARSFEQMMAWSWANPGVVVPVQDFDYLTPFSIVQYVTVGACFVAQVLLVRLLGGTLGQLLLGLRVVPGEKGLVARVSWRTSLLRSAVWLAIMTISLSVLVPILFSYLRPLWHPRLKTWHDSVADTQVITTRGAFAQSALDHAHLPEK